MTLEPNSVYRGLSASVYHALPYVSASRLKQFHQLIIIEGKTLRHVQHELENYSEVPIEAVMGTLSHHITLEKDKPFPLVAISPEKYSNGNKWTYAANECKAWKAAREAEGKIVLKQEEFDASVKMAKNLAEATDTFTVGESELTLLYQHHETGIIIKCRMDFVDPSPIIPDIKCFRSADMRTFTSDAYKRGLHIQAALYLRVWNALRGKEDPKTGFRFWVVENTPPHCVRSFDCSDEFLQRGWEDCLKWLAIDAECTQSGIWPGYEKATLSLPGWAKKGVREDYEY